MSTDPRHKARIQCQLSTFRRFVDQMFDELQDQVDAMAGPEPEETGDWKSEFDKLCGDIGRTK